MAASKKATSDGDGGVTVLQSKPRPRRTVVVALPRNTMSNPTGQGAIAQGRNKQNHRRAAKRSERAIEGELVDTILRLRLSRMNLSGIDFHSQLRRERSERSTRPPLMCAASGRRRKGTEGVSTGRLHPIVSSMSVEKRVDSETKLRLLGRSGRPSFYS